MKPVFGISFCVVCDNQMTANTWWCAGRGNGIVLNCQSVLAAYRTSANINCWNENLQCTSLVIIAAPFSSVSDCWRFILKHSLPCCEFCCLRHTKISYFVVCLKITVFSPNVSGICFILQIAVSCRPPSFVRFNLYDFSIIRQQFLMSKNEDCSNNSFNNIALTLPHVSCSHCHSFSPFDVQEDSILFKR